MKLDENILELRLVGKVLECIRFLFFTLSFLFHSTIEIQYFLFIAMFNIEKVSCKRCILSKYEQMRTYLRILSYLLGKYLKENFNLVLWIVSVKGSEPNQISKMQLFPKINHENYPQKTPSQMFATGECPHKFREIQWENIILQEQVFFRKNVRSYFSSSFF